MRKLLALTFLIGGFLFLAYFPPPGAPAPIKTIALTPESIRTEFQKEQLQKRYDQAALIATRVYSAHRCTTEFASITGQTAIDSRLPVRLVAAIVIVESTCNPTKISRTMDVGLMQVNTRWHPYSVQELLDPRFNMKAGSGILASYVRCYGLVEGLHHYNGLGNPGNEYAEHVLKVAGLSLIPW